MLREAPEDVVIGMDLMWEWHVNSDPRDSKLYQLPPLGTGAGEGLFAAAPARGELLAAAWDPTDTLCCVDGHYTGGHPFNALKGSF